MSFVGNPTNLYAYILFIIFAIIAGLLCIVQVRYLQKLGIIPVLLLPLLSFCVCFENSVLACGTAVGASSSVAMATYFFHSLQIPLFIIILYEVSYRLHEVRLVHFFCIPFDQGPDVNFLPAMLSIWFVRLIAAGLFVMNILVDYSFVSSSGATKTAVAGYPYLAKHSTALSLILALIPPITLSAFAISIAFALYRYALKTQSSHLSQQEFHVLCYCYRKFPLS
jgi:hypothetical protein